jgi:hypothetical protein
MGKHYPAIALCITVLAASAAATGGSIIRSFESPCNDRTDGIDYRGGYLYHANFNGPCEVLKTNIAGSVVSSLKDPPYACGVDYTGAIYWVYTFWPTVPRDRIYRLNSGGSITASFAAPSHGSGVTYAGDYLWYVTAGNHNWNYVYKLTKTGSVASSFQAPHGEGYLNKDIDWGGSYLWLAQSGGGSAQFYQMTAAGSVVFSIFMERYEPTGIAWDGKHVWFADARTDWVYQMKWSGIGVEPASIGKIKAIYK